MAGEMRHQNKAAGRWGLEHKSDSAARGNSTRQQTMAFDTVRCCPHTAAAWHAIQAQSSAALTDISWGALSHAGAAFAGVAPVPALGVGWHKGGAGGAGCVCGHACPAQQLPGALLAHCNRAPMYPSLHQAWQTEPSLLSHHQLQPRALVGINVGMRGHRRGSGTHLP